jgi:hypothetical protein
MCRRSPFLVLALISACGRVAFDQVAPRDASRNVTSTDALAPFGPPQPITTLNGGTNTDDPALSHDELEIVFSSTRSSGAGKCDLYSSTRADLSSPWSAPAAITVLATAGCDSNPMFYANELALRFTGDAAASDLGIFESTRSSRTSAWQPRQLVAGTANTAQDEFAATATTDDLLMILTVFATTNDLVAVTRPTTTQDWATRTTLTELDLGTERSAHLSQDGLQLWFVSDRAGGQGGDDIWTATRATRADPFGNPQPLTEINTAADEDDPWVSDDGARIYFSRFPAGSSTGAQLFAASR